LGPIGQDKKNGARICGATANKNYSCCTMLRQFCKFITKIVILLHKNCKHKKSTVFVYSAFKCVVCCFKRVFVVC